MKKSLKVLLAGLVVSATVGVTAHAAHADDVAPQASACSAYAALRLADPTSKARVEEMIRQGFNPSECPAPNTMSSEELAMAVGPTAQASLLPYNGSDAASILMLALAGCGVGGWLLLVERRRRVLTSQ